MAKDGPKSDSRGQPAPAGRRMPGEIRPHDISISAGRLAALLIIVLAAIPASCRRQGGEVTPQRDIPQHSQPEPTDAVVAPPVFIDTDPDDGTRWLIVEEARDKAEGAWATGAFLPKRNRIVIDTKNVQQFSINIERIDVRWEKLVVIRIDGVNSELRKRDGAIMRLMRDAHGRWVVVERE